LRDCNRREDECEWVRDGREGETASVSSLAAEHRARCTSLQSYMKDGRKVCFGGGRDHDTFPAFMHSTENTTEVGSMRSRANTGG
jgi:hypothetical protein